jgi:hypothetical protein
MKYVTLSAVLASICRFFPNNVRLTRKSKETASMQGDGLI